MLYDDHEPVHKTLVLAMGNDILGDDAVAFETARELRKQHPHADFVETGEAGLALLEQMSGYKRVLLLDSMFTGRHEPGTVVEFSADDFSKVVAPSPHYAGLPEVFQLAQRLGVDFPEVVSVLAMEVSDPYTVGAPLTMEVALAIPEFVDRAKEILQRWAAERSSASLAQTNYA